MFETLSKSIDNIIEEIIQLTYFMRGAISYEEMMLRTPGERDKIGNFIKKRLEQESKKTFPIY